MVTLVPDTLWDAVVRLLPRHPRSPKGGAPRRNDRACLEGIVYVLRGGIPWRLLPKELFGVSASTCWRRFHEWTVSGVWDKVHRKLLSILGEQGELDTERAIIDSASVRALKGGRTPGPTRPTGPSPAASGM